MSLRAIIVLVCVLALAPIKSSLSEEGHDYPSLGHIEGYKIRSYQEWRFDRAEFPLPGHNLTVEGHKLLILYTPDQGQPASQLEMYRSYKLVLDQLGGETLNYDETNGSYGLVGRFTRNGLNVYFSIRPNGSDYYVTVLEEMPFRPLIKPPPGTPPKS
jgi:hypothetical protein